MSENNNEYRESRVYRLSYIRYQTIIYILTSLLVLNNITFLLYTLIVRNYS